MRGVGTASGAISIVNALFNGVGCSAAIELPVRVEADLDAVRAGLAELTVEPADSDTPLVRATFGDALLRHGRGEAWRARLRVESAVPRSVGLKSSSAVSVAIGLAVVAALGRSSSVEDEARAVARSARRIGQSATGAFDDALAAGEGGIALTDNRSDQVLARGTPSPSWRVVLWIPPGHHPPSPEWARRFEDRAEEARGAVDSARRADWLGAMRQNGVLVDEALVRDELSPPRPDVGAHALATSVSGLGPAVAFVSFADRAEEVRRTLAAEVGLVRVVPFRPRGEAENSYR